MMKKNKFLMQQELRFHQSLKNQLNTFRINDEEEILLPNF